MIDDKSLATTHRHRPMRESFAYRSLNSNNYMLQLSLSLCYHAATEFVDTLYAVHFHTPCFPLVVAVLCSVYCPVLSSLLD